MSRRTEGPHAGSRSPDPYQVLTIIQQHLTPTVDLPNIPVVLQAFAHLQLLSIRVRSEARRALEAHDKLITRLIEQGVPPEEWIKSGSLIGKEGRRLRRMRERDEEKMFAFSLAMRQQHIATALVNTRKLEKILGLINLYFPNIPSESHSRVLETNSAPHLYVRIMDDEQADLSMYYRNLVMGWYDKVQRARRRGQSINSIEELTGKSSSTSMEAVARNILVEAEAVIKDQEQLKEIFQEGEDDVDVIDPSRDQDEPGPSTRVKPESHLSPRRVSFSPLLTSIKRERQFTPKLLPTPAKLASPKLSIHSPSIPSNTTAGIMTDTGIVKASPKRKRLSSGLSGVPDFSSPVSKMGSNVSKEMMRPFEQRVLKKSRLSTGGTTVEEVENDPKDTRNGHPTAGRTTTQDVIKRKVLGSGESLENSQSSGESMETKERKRIAKGKWRAGQDPSSKVYLLD